MADDDPFAVFGDKEEEDDDEDTHVSQVMTWAAHKLIEQANERMSNTVQENFNDSNVNTVMPPRRAQQSPLDPTTTSNGIITSDLNEENTIGFHNRLTLWPNSPPPLYLGPVQLVMSLPTIGGGRGFVATRNLSPGTLILVEQPMMEWSDAQIGKALDLISVQQILTHPNALSIVHDMEDFYPTKSEVDRQGTTTTTGHPVVVQIGDMMQMLRVQHENDSRRLNNLIQLAREHNIVCRDGRDLTSTDIVRLLLALRYNGLESGVYRHAAMLNHDCHPNCVKFQPSKKAGYSEVRTTCSVTKGEALTISYLPTILSHATRRRYLWDQHRFDIGVASCLVDGPSLLWRSMECIGNLLPPSSIHGVDETCVTFGIETATRQLEETYRQISAFVDVDNNISISSSNSETSSVWDEMEALELASLELYTEAKDRLLNNENHILLIPCLRLHLDACELVQRHVQGGGKKRSRLVCRLISSARLLLNLQDQYFGRDHFALAQTHLEFAQAVQEVLSTAPKLLVELGLPGLSTFEAYSAAEHTSRKEYERIRSLYPHDAKDLIQSQKQKRETSSKRHTILY